MPTGKITLNLINVAKRFCPLDGGESVDVLKAITCQINERESVAIVGPSGSGKSTLLNIMGTLDRPSSGHVTLDGQDLSHLDDVQLAAVRNSRIGFVFQAHHLLPQCTVLENVLVPTLASKDKALRESGESRARRLLDRVGLGPRLSHRPGQLSGGERQRVAVVRALINGPKLLLADEPTGALDRAAADNLGQLLVELNQEEGVTMVIVTHALDLARRMDRVLELRDGSLRAYRADNTERT
ncbi:MAG: ABC transporter ATP-binding protein [Pedosphaera sp.]|nr:ABC transporter ATP-binding protein [Pedosphaera sp.]